MRWVITAVFLLLMTFGISTAQQQHKPDAMREPQLLASAVRLADNGDGRLFVVHRERQDDWWLQYAVLRYPILGGVVMPDPTRVWAIRVSDPLDQPGLRWKIGADIAVSVDHAAVYVVMTQSYYPTVRTEIYRLDPDAPAFDPPDPQAVRTDFRAVVAALTAARGGEPPDLQTVEAALRDELRRKNPALVPLAEHTLRNIEATCGIDRVRLVAGRHELRIFLTRRDAECGEEEIRYNLDTGEWTPESWQPVPIKDPE